MDEKIYVKVCRVCGKEYKTTQPCKRYCIECTQAAKKEAVKRTREKYKKPQQAKVIKKEKNKDKKWDMTKCRKCFYGAILDGNYQICDYITITGHSRPCNPGAECTEFKPKECIKKRRRVVVLKSKREQEIKGYVQDNIFRMERKRKR